jgi:hypothetical protein
MDCKCRKVCETEVGDGLGFHYFYEVQDVDNLDQEITCPEHPQAEVRDFTIVERL